MEENKGVSENDLLKYAEQQFNYHSDRAKYWKLFIDASNEADNSNYNKDVVKKSSPTTVVVKPTIEKPVNHKFLADINEIFKTEHYKLNTAKEWHKKYLSHKGSTIGFQTFYANLKELVLNKKIANITIEGVTNSVKYWYGPLDCLENDGSLKSDYRTSLEQTMNELLNKKK